MAIDQYWHIIWSQRHEAISDISQKLIVPCLKSIDWKHWPIEMQLKLSWYNVVDYKSIVIFWEQSLNMTDWTQIGGGGESVS